jgi:glyoxylase-like metal-dependent hydrolase (beta-lactamase superfamily II)
VRTPVIELPVLASPLTPYLEIGGDYREVVPGIIMVALPLPFSLGLINVYLVTLESGWLLIDCGMQTEACFQALTRAVERLGFAWAEIHRILLTHIHPDHMGLAMRLVELTGAPLEMHQADNELLAGVADRKRHQEWQSEVLASAGVSPEMNARVHLSLVEMQESYQWLKPSRLLSGGETYSTAHGPLEVIWTPGHSPGHICLYDRERRVLLSGDHILEHISPNIGWHPGHDTLGEFLASLDLIASLEVDLILPSHGAPFSGHREWIRKTHEHHAERCARIVTLVDSGATTANQMAERLWNRTLSPFHLRFAIFEVLAHLEYLERRGMVRSNRGNGVVHWSRAAG